MDISYLQDFLSDLFTNQIIVLAVFAISILIFTLKGGHSKSIR